MTRALTDYEVLSFDCYGTLIDWETGIWDALQPLLMANGAETITRNIALEAFAVEEAAHEAETPDLIYSKVLERVHVALAARLGLRSTTELDAAFGSSIGCWPAFADSADALRSLKQNFKLVILSNVSRAGFAASNRKLGVTFDAIYTAEDIGSYKPSPQNFEYLLEHLDAELGISSEDVLHTAQSLYHDLVPAHRYGLAGAWIDRQNLSRGGHWGATAPVDERPPVDFIFPNLASLVAAVDRGRS